MRLSVDIHLVDLEVAIGGLNCVFGALCELDVLAVVKNERHLGMLPVVKQRLNASARWVALVVHVVAKLNDEPCQSTAGDGLHVDRGLPRNRIAITGRCCVNLTAVLDDLHRDCVGVKRIVLLLR